MAIDTTKQTLREDLNSKGANRDPITGEPGAHEIGTGLGAAAAASAGAVLGSVVGPVGTATGAIIGAIAGGVVGGFAGSGIAELVNPTEVDTYYSTTYSSRPYVAKGEAYDTYKPAYRAGYDARAKYANKSFDEVKTDLQKDWEKTPASGPDRLDWNKAEPAIRDSYDRTGDLYKERFQKASDSSSANASGSSSTGSLSQPKKAV